MYFFTLFNKSIFKVFVDKKTGEVLKEGDTYKHPKMAETLQRIADNGADEFYTGEVARNLVKDISVGGGIITKEDLEAYEVSWETPVSGKLPNTDYTVYSSPPPASGSVMLAILAIAGQYNPLPPDLNRVTPWHR